MISKQALAPAIASIEEEITSLTQISSTLRALAGKAAGGNLTVIGAGKKPTMSTVEMARQVLSAFGKLDQELSYQDIREGIKNMFNTEAAQSLNQMIYKRSAKGGEFYRTKDGKFGLSSWKKDKAEAA